MFHTVPQLIMQAGVPTSKLGFGYLTTLHAQGHLLTIYLKLTGMPFM